MIRRQPNPTAVHAGAGAWAAVRAGLGGRPLFVVDANVDLAEPDAIRVDPDRADLGTVRLLAARVRAVAPDAVVGVGGGGVLDLVKLACLAERDIDVLEARGRRAGVVALPPGSAPAPRRVFAPTTIGTGVEVSAVACVRLGGHKRIVVDGRLRPDVAVLDPALTATLPARLLREGVLEALMRVVGPVVGSPPVGGLPDAEAAMLVRELVAVGDRLAGGDTGPQARLDAAVLSAATHTGWALVGRDTYAAKHWYLANELSTVLGVRKVVATALLLPAVWTRIASGDRRFGDAERLAAAWSWVGGDEPVAGLRALLDRWDLRPDVEVPAGAARAAARRAVRSWGGPLPMLSGLDVADVEELYTEASGGVVACST